MSVQINGRAAFIQYVSSNQINVLVPNLNEGLKHAVVEGAVTGGGLTVIANAPNPAGIALLKHGFADQSVGAGGLAAGALVPTAIAAAALMLL